MNTELSRLAHDLKSPLTALKLAASVFAARRAVGDPEEDALLSVLDRTTRRFEQIADELTKLSEQMALAGGAKTAAGRYRFTVSPSFGKALKRRESRGLRGLDE